jgi:regulator of sirC expression with transglutaminase-like and TPR domain
VKELADFLAGRTERLDLDRGALLLARCETPELDPEPYLSLLDSHAAELAGRLRPGAGGDEFVERANEYLFEELGFTGNQADYYNPANSCLNEVLTARAGIPISLSVVYMEIARRLGRPVFGIGLPGHFVIRYDDGFFQTYIDPFHCGKLLDVPACRELVQSVAGVDLLSQPSALAPVSGRQILHRMINNLRAVYFSRRSHRKALRILNLLVMVNPECVEEYKQRGLVHLQLEHIREARDDFERYLVCAPAAAADREEIQKQVTALQRWVVGLN